jgi:hypothetical protein
MANILEYLHIMENPIPIGGPTDLNIKVGHMFLGTLTVS